MDFLLLLAGPVFIAVTFALMVLRVEPFANFFYLCAWYGLIFTFDQLIRRREGRSLIGRCGPGFLLLLFWSAVTWYFFELLNFRLQNWYYVFVVDHQLLRPIGTFFSFATVFPGIFWIDHYLARHGVGQHVRGRPLRFSAAGLRHLQVLGVLFLALPMLFPTYFFPMVWGTLVLLLAPVEYRRGGDGLLRQLEAGNYGPLLRTLLAGLIAGFFWESLNFWARAKWIYTVPFFEEFKLFEMPLAGFLGFPPFAVECAIVYRFLVRHRLAPAFGAYVDQKPETGGLSGKVAVILLAALFVIGTDFYVVGRVTITSVTPEVGRIETLDQHTRDQLKNHDVRHLTSLEGRNAENLWRRIKADLDKQQAADLERLTELYLHQGIGVEYGNMLVKAGIGSLEELGKLSAEEVRERLAEAAPEQKLPPLARIRVWVRRVPKGS